MNEWQLVHGDWAVLLPRGLLLLLLHSLVEQALLGHSIVHHEHSAVISKGNSFRHMEFMSRCNASVFLFITYVLDEWYWMGPNQGYQNFWWILCFQKISNISWINILGKPKNNKLIYHINSHFFGLKFAKFYLKNQTLDLSLLSFFFFSSKISEFLLKFSTLHWKYTFSFNVFSPFSKPQKIRQGSCQKRSLDPKWQHAIHGFDLVPTNGKACYVSMHVVM